MGWSKLDDGFYRHPKARAVGKDGRALFVAGLCWAAGHLTDGFIAAADLGLIAAEAEVRPKPTARRLEAVGMWEPTDGGWVIHDYLDYNPTAGAEREKRRKRAEAGRKGGLKSRPPRAGPEPNGEPNTEANASPNAQANGQANGEAPTKQIGTPSPYPPSGGYVPAAADAASPPPVDNPAAADHPDPSHTSPDQARQALIDQAARLLAERRQAQHRPDAGPGWVRNATTGIAKDHHDRAHSLLLNWPENQPYPTPETLAELLEPTPPQSEPVDRFDHTYDDQQRALLAAAEQHMADLRTDPPTPPDPARIDRLAQIRAAHRLPTRTDPGGTPT